MQHGLPMPGEGGTTQYAQPEKPLFLSAYNWLRSCFWMLLRGILEIIGLKAVIADLRDKLAELEVENQKLYEQLHLDSSTSSVPPSKGWKGCCDPCESNDKEGVRPVGSSTDDTTAPDGGRETPTSVTGYINGNAGKKRTRGGQRKHRPAFMHIDDVRDGDSVMHYPGRCSNCQRFDQCFEDGRFRKFSTAYEYDIEIVRTRRMHLQYEAPECPGDGSLIHEPFTEVIGTQFYGTNVQLHVLTWHHIFHGSYERIGLAAKELFGLSLSAGTANAIVRRASAGILGSGFMDAERFFILLYETVMGADETSACVDGRNAWVHTAVTANVTLLTAHWQRGYDGMTFSGVLQFFTQKLISDCWAPYFNDDFKFSHSLCDGHILRELVAAAYFRGQLWAIDMFDLLLEILDEKREAVERGNKSLSQEYINDITAKYRQIIDGGFKENPDVEKGKTVALLKRLRINESAVLAFAIDFRVHFTNNASEQSLRDLKVALRVMAQFKTLSGLADYCIIQSFMDTCRKQGRNPYDMMKSVLSGGDIIEAVFGAEKSVRIKEMIGLTDIIAKGDPNEITAAIADLPFSLSEELLAAASFGRYKVLNAPPPEKTSATPGVPKDKMQAAREALSQKHNDNSVASFYKSPQDDTGGTVIKIKQKTRAGPISA